MIVVGVDAISEAGVKNFPDHLLGEVFAGSQEDAPKEMSFGVLSFGGSIGIKVPHKFRICSKLIEEQLDCQLRLGR